MPMCLCLYPYLFCPCLFLYVPMSLCLYVCTNIHSARVPVPLRIGACVNLCLTVYIALSISICQCLSVHHILLCLHLSIYVSTSMLMQCPCLSVPVPVPVSVSVSVSVSMSVSVSVSVSVTVSVSVSVSVTVSVSVCVSVSVLVRALIPVSLSTSLLLYLYDYISLSISLRLCGARARMHVRVRIGARRALRQQERGWWGGVAVAQAHRYTRGAAWALPDTDPLLVLPSWNKDELRGDGGHEEGDEGVAAAAGDDEGTRIRSSTLKHTQTRKSMHEVHAQVRREFVDSLLHLNTLRRTATHGNTPQHTTTYLGLKWREDSLLPQLHPPPLCVVGVGAERPGGRHGADRGGAGSSGAAVPGGVYRWCMCVFVVMKCCSGVVFFCWKCYRCVSYIFVCACTTCVIYICVCICVCVYRSSFMNLYILMHM